MLFDRDGTVLWISKGENGKAAKVVVKLQPRKESEDESDSFGTPRGEFSSEGVSTHREVRTYPIEDLPLYLESYHSLTI